MCVCVYVCMYIERSNNIILLRFLNFARNGTLSGENDTVGKQPTIILG